jgi:hypothetical protein
MFYKVTFTPADDRNGDFAIFQDVAHAHEFVASRHPGYGKDYVITEHSDDGTVVDTIKAPKKK